MQRVYRFPVENLRRVYRFPVEIVNTDEMSWNSEQPDVHVASVGKERPRARANQPPKCRLHLVSMVEGDVRRKGSLKSMDQVVGRQGLMDPNRASGVADAVQ